MTAVVADCVKPVLPTYMTRLTSHPCASGCYFVVVGCLGEDVPRTEDSYVTESKQTLATTPDAISPGTRHRTQTEADAGLVWHASA